MSAICCLADIEDNNAALPLSVSGGVGVGVGVGVGELAFVVVA
jgi:hypothetical protein